MNPQLIFWLLVMLAIFQLFTISSANTAIKELLKTKVFRDKLERLEEKQARKKKNPSTGVGLAIVALLVPAFSYASEIVHPPMLGFEITATTVYAMLGVNIVLAVVQWFLRRLFQNMVNIDQTDEDILLAEADKKKKRIDVLRLLTDAVPLEEEASVETDHEYDGIRELDNNLPPWWKYGFYLTIVVGIIYILNFHFFKFGDLQIQAYEKELVAAEKAVQDYLKAQALNVDENSVEYKTDPAVLKSGKSIFNQYCKVCHGAEGQGLVGPNFTDNYWIHGGSIQDIFKTVKYGAKNGMKSWKDELNPVDMQAVSSFIKSLVGTNPANPKAPQGELYVEPEQTATPADSSIAVNQ